MLDAAALDDYVVELGVAVLRFFLHFAAPDAAPPLRFLRLGSRAYLYADALIDLRHDLDFGVINVPREDVERYGLSLDMADPRLRRWMAERGAAILAQFDEALGQSRRLERWSLRASAHLFLSTKRRKLRRFLQREGLLVAGAQPATGPTRRPTFRDGAAGPPGGG
jgi:hypothetical protein